MQRGLAPDPNRAHIPPGNGRERRRRGRLGEEARAREFRSFPPLEPLQHLQPGRTGCFSRGRNGVTPCEAKHVFMGNPGLTLGLSYLDPSDCRMTGAKHIPARSAWVEMQRGLVPEGRGYFPHVPGTSCLATIVLSLRDKRHSTAEALLKLAFMG
jgi:hypothetical protein